MGFLGFRRTAKQPPAGRAVTLQEAVREGLATFEVRGLGQGVTSGVELIIYKLTDEALTILVPRGTDLVPFDRG